MEVFVERISILKKQYITWPFNRFHDVGEEDEVLDVVFSALCMMQKYQQMTLMSIRLILIGPNGICLGGSFRRCDGTS